MTQDRMPTFAVRNPAFAPPVPSKDGDNGAAAPYSEVTADAVYNSGPPPLSPSETQTRSGKVRSLHTTGGFTVPIAGGESSTDGPRNYENQTIQVYENQNQVRKTRKGTTPQRSILNRTNACTHPVVQLLLLRPADCA